MRIIALAVSSTAIVAISLLNSCQGPPGDPGPQGVAGTPGTTGATGAAGAVGPKGDAGAPNVVYSDWKSVNWSVTGNGAGDNAFYALSSPTTANALFTKEAISSAAIFTYVKYRTYVDSIPYGKYKLVERISNNRYVSHYFKVPGRKDATFFDYGFSYVDLGDARENYFSPSIQVNTFTLGQPIPELKNRSAEFVRGLVGDLPQFRHVIVYGGAKGGRLAAVDWSNYNEVKKMLNLTD